MHAVAHLVRVQRATDLPDEVRVVRDLGEGERLRRGTQPAQVVFEAEDASVVEAQPLPHRVAALHDAVEGAHAGLVAVHERTVHVDEDVRVAWIEALQHDYTRIRCSASRR